MNTACFFFIALFLRAGQFRSRFVQQRNWFMGVGTEIFAAGLLYAVSVPCLRALHGRV